MTRYPFPHYEVEHQQQWQYSCDNDPCDYMWVTTQTTPRTTYFLAGQAIATRVNGTLYYLHTDHLGSTSLMSNSSGYSVSGRTTRYLPYGERRTTPTTTLTERGRTGHHENRDIGLTYMNARYYVPGLGRFLTADPIVPAPANPQSHNRYSYVLGNPLRYTDPTGHECYDPSSGDLFGTCTGGFSLPLQPSEPLSGAALWAIMQFQRRYYIDGYGLFDIGHVNRGYDLAKYIIEEIRKRVGNGGGMFPVSSEGSVWFGIKLDDFTLYYWVSSDLTEEEIIGVALAIYMDFEQQYERHQGSRIDAISSFSPEDLPSNYLGFWAYVNGYSKDQIPALLEQLGKITPYHGSSMVLGWGYDRSDIPSLVAPRFYLTIPRNYQFKPMARVGTTWRNVEWPHYMHLTPIGSSNSTWQPCRTHPVICGG